MLKRIIYGAVILLVIQLGLTAFLTGNHADDGAGASVSLFPELNSRKVSSINLTDSEKNSLHFAAAGNGWQLEKSPGVPVDAGKIKALLDTLSISNKGLAVATSEGSAERFKTGEQNYLYHMVAWNGTEKAADLYIGSVAGYQHSYVRENGSKAVYSLALNSVDFSAKPVDWLDKSCLKIDSKKVSGITVGGQELLKDKDAWSVSGNEPRTTDTARIEELLTALANLSPQDLVAQKDAAARFGDKAETRLTLTMDDGKNIVYSFVKKDDNYIVNSSSAKDLFMTVKAWQADKIVNFSLKPEEAAGSGAISDQNTLAE